MTFGFPKPPPRYQVKGEKRKADEALKRAVYAEVDRRDDRRCRVCDCRCRQTMAEVGDRLEHHHLVFRSRGGKHTSSNVAVVCHACHVEVQQHRVTVTGDANGKLKVT